MFRETASKKTRRGMYYCLLFRLKPLNTLKTFFVITEGFLIADWSRAMFVGAIFRETSTGMDVKNCRCYYRKTTQQQFSMVSTLIDLINVKMFKTLL